MVKKKKCIRKYCELEATQWDYCEDHFIELQESNTRRENAAELLHTGRVEGKSITSDELKEEYFKLIDFHDEVRSSFRNRRPNGHIPNEEVEAAPSWCTGLAEVIYYDELIYRGVNVINTNSHLREQLWNRIINVQKGLLSNGNPRN